MQRPGDTDGLDLAHPFSVDWPATAIVPTSGHMRPTRDLPGDIGFVSKPWVPGEAAAADNSALSVLTRTMAADVVRADRRRTDETTDGPRRNHEVEAGSIGERRMHSLRGWMVGSALAASAMACSAVPAAADWQYTQWGMTPDQVKAASNDAAQPNTDRTIDAAGLKAALTAPYQGASLPFTAVFYFDAADRLKLVTLNPIGDIACPVVVQALGANHGLPEGKADMVHATTLRWDDVENDNLIVYVNLGHGHCTIQFSKLPPTSPNGKSL